MANVFPFRPYRYAASAGPLENLVTQPYDKISEAMRKRYLALDPHNLVRVILPEKTPQDDGVHNAYTRAADHFRQWIDGGILEQADKPGFYAYFQEFDCPDSGERLVRKGFIGLGAVEDYSEGCVHRHEQTLSGPKKDRLELLRHTRAHFGQLFMLYPDHESVIDRMLDEVASASAAVSVTDEYGCLHRLWSISEPARIEEIRTQMADKKLLIADGHHRYETALAFRDENPHLADARKVMMTFINMYSPGLKILATHRLVRSLPGFGVEEFLVRAGTRFRHRNLSSLEELKAAWNEPHTDEIRIGVVIAGHSGVELLTVDRRPGDLVVKVLHQTLLGEVLGISEEAVREQKFLEYVRGVDAAAAKAASGEAQVGFLLEPASIGEVAEVSFGGGVMPQKSTDFYPKLLSGLTIYKLRE